MEWDRKNQRYWILRRGDPWKVINMKTNEEVADFPAFCYKKKLTDAICFAQNDEQVKELLKEV